MPEDNIQQTGPLTGGELRQINAALFGDKQPAVVQPFNPVNPGADLTEDVYSPLYDGKGDYWGRSRFDRRNPIVEDQDFQNVSDLRAKEQSGFNKVLNGTIKMLSTAGTTFLDNTVGFVWGLGQGFANLADNDDDTNFWRGLWDNDFNKAMMSAQDAMEKIAPNYYTQKELTNPWYNNIFTANFWGDKFLKNMGFTMGSLAAMAVPGVGDLGGLAKAGTQGLAKSIAAGKWLKNTKFGTTLYRGADKAGSIAQKLVNTAVSAHGEAAIEAINAVKANKDAFLQNLNNWKNDQIQQARTWYGEHSAEPGAYEQYMQMLGDIDEGFNQANLENDNTVRGLGNSVYGMNMLLLGITNNLEFGKYIKGGFNQNQSISKLRLLANGTETKDIAEAGRAWAKGQLKVGADESLKKVTGKDVRNAVFGTLSRNLEEGFEEGAQNLISDSGQMQAQAKINVALKDWSKQHKNSLFALSVNPDVTDDLVNRSKAFMTAWSENFGSIGSPGWEEVFLGALTGGLGTLGFKIDQKTGTVRPSWQGGFVEEIRRPSERFGQQEAYAEMLNRTLFNDKFHERTAHAIISMALADGMETDLLNNDILNYKNKELMQVTSDALYAKDNDALEMYRSFYEELAKNVTDKDVDNVKASFRNPISGESYFDNLTNDEVKERMKDKAKSTLDKIDSALTSYDWHLRTYGDKVAQASPSPNLVRVGLNEIVTLDALNKDLERRTKELNEQKAQLDESNAEDKKQIESLDASIKEIENYKKEVQATYDKYTKDPSTVFDAIQNIINDSFAHRIRKDADTVKELYKNASTIQDVANIYYASNPGERNEILNEVYDSVSPEMQKTIDTFKDYVATTKALPAVVSERLSDFGTLVDDVTAHNYRRNVGNLLDRVVNRIVSDPNVTFENSKDLVVKAIKQEAGDLREGKNGYRKSETSEFYADELDNIAGKLEKYNIIYQTSKAGEKQSTTTQGQSGNTQQPGAQPEQPGANQQNPSTPPSSSQSENPAQPEGGQEGSTQEGNEQQGSSENLNSNSGYTYYPLFTNTNDSTDGRLAEVKDSTDVKRRRGQVKQWADSAKDGADFLARVHASGFKFDGRDELGGQILKAFDAYKSGKISEKEFLDLFTPEQFRNQPQAPDTTTQESNTEEQPPVESSLYGTAFLKYAVTGHEAEELRNSSTMWFRDIWNELNMGYDLDDIQNNYIYKLLNLDSFKGKDGKGRIPVRYLKVNNHLTTSQGGDYGLNRFVLLATEYTDDVKGVFPEDMRAKFRLFEYDGKQYLVIGSLGAYTPMEEKGKQRKLTPLEKMFEDVNTAATQQLNDEGGAYTVLKEGDNGEYTNYIYQVNNGEVVTGFRGKPKEARSLKSLLDNPTTNPRGLTAKDLAFAVILGDKETGRLTPKLVGNLKDEANFRKFTPGQPGQVYVYIPDSTGQWIPWSVDPIVYSEIMSLDENNPIRKEVDGLIKQLAENLSRHEFTPEEIKERNILLATIRDTLQFGSKDVGGSYFSYNAPEEVPVDEGLEPIYNGHNLTATVAGHELFDVPFDLMGQSPEIIEAKLREIMEALQPRYNIKSSVLQNTPEYYVDNGVLQTDLQFFGTVNARSFVYPLNSDMTPNVEFVATKTNPDTPRGGSIQRVWFGGKQYRKTQNGFEYSNGKPIKDPELTQQLNDVLNLTPDSATFTYNRAPYWIIEDRAYTSTKDGRFSPVMKTLADEYYAKYLKKKEAEERKKRNEEANKKLEENPPKVTEQKPQEEKPTVPVQKPGTPAVTREKNSIFVDEITKLAASPVTQEQAAFMNTLEGSADYLDALDKEAWDATKLDVLTLMVAKQLGVDPLDLTMDKVMDELWKSKYHERLANATDTKEDGTTTETIEDIIDNIIKCGL